MLAAKATASPDSDHQAPHFMMDIDLHMQLEKVQVPTTRTYLQELK